MEDLWTIVRVRGVTSPWIILSIFFKWFNAAGVALRLENTDADVSSSSSLPLPPKSINGGGTISVAFLTTLLFAFIVVGNGKLIVTFRWLLDVDDEEEDEEESSAGDNDRRAWVIGWKLVWEFIDCVGSLEKKS